MANFTIENTEVGQTVIKFFPEHGGAGYARTSNILDANEKIWAAGIKGEIILDLTEVKHAETTTLIEIASFLSADPHRTVSIRASESIAQALKPPDAPLVW
ncbi:MAG: hypothetical protein AAB557_05975 [Patescibacteria group bacterium]